MFSDKNFRDVSDVVSNEPMLKFDPTVGVYKLVGEPKRYQWLVEMLTVMFPQVEVRVGIPEDLGRNRMVGVVRKDVSFNTLEKDYGLIFPLHEWVNGEGKHDLADCPELVADIIMRVKAFVEECEYNQVDPHA